MNRKQLRLTLFYIFQLIKIHLETRRISEKRCPVELMKFKIKESQNNLYVANDPNREERKDGKNIAEYR